MRQWLLAASLVLLLTAAFYGQAPAAKSPERALLDQYCVGCHNQRAKTADLMLDQIDPSEAAEHAETWEKVIRKVNAGMMPPAGMPRPGRAQLDALTAALAEQLDKAAAADPQPGSVLLHRLNRAEYGNAIRDLLALNVDVTTLLPADDSSEGFDNIAEALKVSPALMEGYVSAAANISRLAVGDPGISGSTTTYRQPSGFAQTDHIEGLPLGTRGGMEVEHTFPLDAEYTLKVGGRGGGRGLGPQRPDSTQYVELTLDGERVKVFPLGGRGMDVKLPVTAGPHTLGAAVLNGYQPGLNELWKVYGGGGGVSNIQIVGPTNASGPGDTPSRRKIFVCHPSPNASQEVACAKQIVTQLARHAYRRPPTDAEIETLLSFYQQARNDRDFDAGIQRALARILADPQFIFRFEHEPDDVAPGAIYRIGDLELASRMSFFIWSSIPDDELLDLAVAGKLHEPAALRAQTERMLRDPRSKALVTNFAGQWLGLREVRNAEPQTRGFNENLRQAMLKEADLFVDTIIHEDRSVRDFLDGGFTFVDERLAAHYGIPNIHGSRFRRIDLPEGDPRRGLLGKGAILLFTSVATRTSPVTRGKFVLENILGSAPPLPPPNVPSLEDAGGDGKIPSSVRAQMELHRKNPVCASCHKIMDPIGFSMENFDIVGRWRTQDNGTPVDASSVLVDGTKLDGVASLRAALLSRFDVFARTLSEKLMTYGLGRALKYTDMPAVRQVVRGAAKDDYRFSSVILGIVESEPFQMRRKAATAQVAQR